MWCFLNGFESVVCAKWIVFLNPILATKKTDVVALLALPEGDSLRWGEIPVGFYHQWKATKCHTSSKNLFRCRCWQVVFLLERDS